MTPVYSYIPLVSNVYIKNFKCSLPLAIRNTLKSIQKKLIRDAGTPGHAKMFTEAPFTIAKAHT